MNVQKNGTRKVGFFSEKELFSTSPDVGHSHPLNDAVIQGWNIVRQYFKVPIRLTSTYRTVFHETVILKKATIGDHNKGNAIDGEFFNKPDETKLHPFFIKEIIDKGPLYRLLREAGINCFGLYDGFIHLGIRDKDGPHTDAFGTYFIWDYTSSAKKSSSFFFQPLTK